MHFVCVTCDFLLECYRAVALWQTLFIKIAYKCICSPQLERRLNGMQYLQQIVEMTLNRVKAPTGVRVYGIESEVTSAYYVRVEIAGYLTPARLMDALPVRVLHDVWPQWTSQLFLLFLLL